MADLPSYVAVLFDGYSDGYPDPSVDRVEMERGSPKQSLINSQVLAKVNATLWFKSAADVVSFETWYFDTIKRIGSFNMTHPRTGSTIVAAFEGGRIGLFEPASPDFSRVRCACVIEYLR